MTMAVRKRFFVMVKFCALFMVVLMLCGCAASRQADDSAEPSVPSVHADLLAKEYNSMAMLSQANGEYKMAAFFNARAGSAGRGHWVRPESSTNPVLLAAHDELMRGLTEAMIPENALWLARAQVNYECWLKRNDDDCRRHFERAMQSVTQD